MGTATSFGLAGGRTPRSVSLGCCGIPRFPIHPSGWGFGVSPPSPDALPAAAVPQEDKGGTSSLSASKWTTFLKATLICVDPVTKGNFNWLQDVFFVPAGDWRHSKVYGLFTNTW